MTISFAVKTPSDNKSITVEFGTTAYFIGANGGGKTRLAAQIEDQLGAMCHRISAHRALNMNPAVAKISEGAALNGLRFGAPSLDSGLPYRLGARWAQRSATNLLNDYDYLIQVLFAEQSNTALKSHKNLSAKNGVPAQKTNFEKLVEIWDKLLPHRKLEISGDNIEVRLADSTDSYSAADMSDGERAIFYLIGQTLVAAKNTLIIFDEPELHIHRAIVASLWDEIEAARPDCSMVIISHDLDFVASRKGQKFVLRAFKPSTGWIIEEVPEESGFSEEITTLILGSRRPVLFVEGGSRSIDKAVFRACYPEWTIIPRGSCEEVLHAVVTMRANAALTRVSCAGIVDADAYTEDEAAALHSKGVEILSVSEIENLFLFPEVVKAIAKWDGHDKNYADMRAAQVFDELLTHASLEKNQLDVVLRYCRRRIDRMLKKIDLSAASDVEALAETYKVKTEALDVTALATLAREAIQNAVGNQDIAALLRWYDNKGVLSFVAKVKGVNKDKFEQWVLRVMRNGTVPEMTAALKAKLPIPVAT
ncbi:AAA family ATPase [Janthinobacterium sp. SUN211]|uniref:AAA family ATPase n=1 Tax=Janthinobacterium sp. SUN211 TaxID=3014786 RepID=UPI002712ACA0|nr:AAA family ATPase [Janthinobacterium sp. SUN211]MDO8051141.1 AAA family ATPase [Janthinobacterium sp. SUN211]